MFWKGLTPAPQRFIALGDPPLTDNRVVLTPMPVNNKVFFYKRKRAKKVVSTESVLEVAD
jgi:hypothetical protein